MADIARSCISLRIFGTDLDPAILTTRLGCVPTAAARTGDTRTTPHGELRFIREGFWRLDSGEINGGELEVKAAALLSRLTSDLDVWREIAERYRVDLFCGLFLETWNEGFELSPRLLSMLGERHIAIGFDIYPADADNQEGLT